MQFSFAIKKRKNQKRFLILKLKEELIMALNDTFKILEKKSNLFDTDLLTNSPPKDYWEEECKKYPSKKECLFYCD